MDRRKFVIGLGALASGSAAAMGTGAFSAGQMERDANFEVTADDGSLVSLIPGHEFEDTKDDSSLSEEFVTTVDDQLDINFRGDGDEGVNVGSTYQLGAIGDDQADALDDLPDWDEDDVIYGELDDQWLDKADTRRDPAFVIENETDTNITVQLSWDSEEEFEDFHVALVMQGQDITDSAGNPSLGSGSAAAFELGVDDQPEGETTGGIESGMYAGVSIIAKAGDDAEIDDYDGELLISAEGAVQQDD